ncbi:MAG TPA: hypothetical protein VMF05_01035 [Stellaceae bacterium]|nr:hypothetical protein [Stellaceae bacterium]
MAIYVEGRGLASEAEPVGLLTEGAAGIAVIVLMVIALAGVSSELLASIATIVIGVGLMVQAFNSAAETAKVAQTESGPEIGGEVSVDCLCGLTGIVLGILGLVGVGAAYLLPPALIVFGAALLLSGGISMRPRNLPITAAATETRVVSFQGSPAAGGMEILIGIAAIVLGILALILAHAAVLLLVGLLAVGAALLLVSATFSGAVMRIFTATAA